MNLLRFLTAGESHGPKLTAILEGMPAGLQLEPSSIDAELARRQVAYGAGGRMKIEKDRARITAGVAAGLTTGGPIALEVPNRDHGAWAEKEIPPMTAPRPGHADLAGAIKYGHRDLRLALERASARETTMRVAVGAICKAYLAHFGIRVGGYVTAVGSVQAAMPHDMGYIERFEAAEGNDMRCPDPAAAEAMRAHVREIMLARDTVGGVFEVVALGVPPGLGSYVHFDRKLEARLGAAILSIPAVKGLEIGPAFVNAGRPGTEVHDPIDVDGSGNLIRRSNRAGGLEGGVTTGEPLVLRAAMKPIATTLTPIDTVDLATGQPSPTRYERSDFSAAPRAVVIGEAMVAWVLAGALMEKLGGDSLDEHRQRFAALRRNRLADLPMDNRPWRFGYPEPGGEE
jgi:chorismate synthase